MAVSDSDIDALLTQCLLSLYQPSEEEIEEFMRTTAEDLSAEDNAMLEKMGRELPSRMKEWRAAEQGCIIPKDEHADRLPDDAVADD